MIKKLFPPKKEDICPNCGTACFATDVLCPNCNKNLDDLFEELTMEALETKPFITIKKEHKLLLKWVLATVIGFVLGEVFLSPRAFDFLPVDFPQSAWDLLSIVLGVSPGINAGLLVGAFQWLILRSYTPNSWWWIIVTPLGMASGSIIETLFFKITSHYSSIDIWISIFLYGVVIGLCQWAVLRQSLINAWTWVITNGFGWALAITIGEDIIRPRLYDFGFLDFVQYLYNPIYEIAIYGTVGILIGIITGLLLLWLLKQKGVMVQTAA